MPKKVGGPEEHPYDLEPTDNNSKTRHTEVLQNRDRRFHSFSKCGQRHFVADVMGCVGAELSK